jgi:hypothetical protein
MTDVKCTLHDKPLGISKARSAHPGEAVKEKEQSEKGAGGGG